MKKVNHKLIEKLRVMVGEVLTPDLLRPDWRAKAATEHHTYGHCYVAAEALFHLIGGWESEFVPRYVKYFDESDNMVCTHWWLYSSRRNMIYDPTKEQYLHANLDPPYHNKKTSFFLTKTPSKRAVIVMDRVKERFNSNDLAKIVETFKVEEPVFDKFFIV